MCGIALLVSSSPDLARDSIARMTGVVRHRGPDGSGLFIESGSADRLHLDFAEGESTEQTLASQAGNRDVAIAMGHRRLSIIDTGHAAYQPFASADDRHLICFNGEIYNYVELRRELESLGERFRTSSDTEVLLSAYRTWGRACLDRLNGMFAFVVFDRRDRRLFIARDRYGVKPLYVWQSDDGRCLGFASEIKQFRELAAWQARVNRQRAYDFLVWGLTDHTEETLFHGVRQVPAGSYLEGTPAQLLAGAQPTRWYHLEERIVRPGGDPVEGFRDRLQAAVDVRLRSDVPLAFSLSGGLDSSSVAGLAAGRGTRMDAFTLSPRQADINESAYAMEVARKWDFRLHEVTPEFDSSGLAERLREMLWYHDEPFSSASIVAEWSIYAALAAEGFKVNIDGHGADEQLAGYQAFHVPRIKGLLYRARLVEAVRQALALAALADNSRYAVSLLAKGVAPAWTDSLVRRLNLAKSARVPWLGAQGYSARNPYVEEKAAHSIRDLSLTMLTHTSLPLQLKWADRDSMAHSVESRSPFLDYRLVEFVLGLEDAEKLDQGVSKRVLREAMQGVLPERVRTRRSKLGFVAPEEDWVRGPGKAYFTGLLRELPALTDGFVNPGSDPDDDFCGLSTPEVWRAGLFAEWIKSYQVDF